MTHIHCYIAHICHTFQTASLQILSCSCDNKSNAIFERYDCMVMSSRYPSRPKSNEFLYWLAKIAIQNCYRGHPLHSFLISPVSKKNFLTDFKVTQVLICILEVLKELPIESVVPNGLNFDILLLKYVLGTTIHISFGDL